MLRLLLKIALLTAATAAFSQDVVDRMVAVVNKQVILQSELEDAVHIDSLLQGKPQSQVTEREMDAVLERMIDQLLVQQQIVDNSLLEPKSDEITSRIQDVRSSIPGADAEQKWQSMLAAYGVTEQDVQKHIATQLLVLRFVDLRFRVPARADRAAISQYYQDTLLPELRKKGVPAPSLEQVSDKIQRILTEQHINDLLASWLQTLRLQAHIEKLNSGAAAAVPGADR
jgi:peptidyl-prolyl cis-trans isomerase SurA